MPTYLTCLEIDWNWPCLSEEERLVVRKYEAGLQADPRSLTVARLRKVLAEASQELSGREIRSRAEDEYGKYNLKVFDGECTDAGSDSFNSDGRFPEPITPDDYRSAGVKKLTVSLYFSESILREIQAEAHRLDRSLSWIMQKAWEVSKSCSTAQADGNERCSESGPIFVAAGRPQRQTFYLPVDFYEELLTIAADEDCSMSKVMQRALVAAWSEIKNMPSDG